MIPLNELFLFAAAALLMVLTPVPNMNYLISRSISQGRRAGVISLFDLVAGFLAHMLAAGTQPRSGQNAALVSHTPTNYLPETIA